MENLHQSPPQQAKAVSESPSSAAKAPESGDVLSGGERNGPVSVLVVDDDPETARALCRALSATGNEVHVSQSGAEALTVLKGTEFDVVLSDIAMPQMDGFGLLHAVRQINHTVPVVLLTGDPTVSTAARALEVGAFRYVTKPVNPKDLASVVQKAAHMYRMALVKQQAARLLGQHSPVGTDHDSLNRSFDRCMDKLWMAYQPIIHGSDKSIFGYEALMRSKEPELPHPGAVLDAAEQLGRLDELGRTVRKRSAVPMPDAPEGSVFFINLHVRDLLDDTLLSEKSPLAPYSSRIVLEVTERASLAEVPDVQQRIAVLREMGFRIAVDDLGAGYAGLTSFALLEPELVKLDMSLVRDVHLSKTKTKVVRSMINLAKDMGMLVVGEGIECQEESDAMVELGCDFLQGFFYARPAEPFPGVTW